MKKQKIGIFVLIIGLIVMLYPLLSDIFFSYNHSAAISNYKQTVNNNSEEEIQKRKEDSDKYNQELVDSEKGQVKRADEESQKAESYLNLLVDGETLGYIEIPSIDVDLPIYHGIKQNVLEFGIGHLENTSLPNGKIGTHCVLAGHSGFVRSRLFDDIDKLDLGDIFYISILDDKFAYEVDQIKVVKPEETKEIEIDEEKEYVTLITCVPYGINSHRLLVRGEGIDESSIPMDEETNKNANNQENSIEQANAKEEIREIAISHIDRELVFKIILAIFIIIIIIVLVAIYLYIDDYNQKIKRKIRRIRENDEEKELEDYEQRKRRNR